MAAWGSTLSQRAQRRIAAGARQASASPTWGAPTGVAPTPNYSPQTPTNWSYSPPSPAYTPRYQPSLSQLLTTAARVPLALPPKPRTTPLENTEDSERRMFAVPPRENRRRLQPAQEEPELGDALRKLAKKPLPGLDAGQTQVANTILSVGLRRGAKPKELLAAVETGLVESGLSNLDYGDADSLGWRQERTSQYGAENAMNVRGGAKRFFQESISDTGGSRGRGQTAGQLAQTIQGSAFPERYDQVKGQAQPILSAFLGNAEKLGVSNLPKASSAGPKPPRAAALEKFLPGGDRQDYRKTDPTLLRKVVKVARESGDPIDINSGFRSYGEQAALYDAYQSGTGNLAAPPGSSNHEGGGALDLDMTDAQRALLGKYGLGLPVPGEDWHVELNEDSGYSAGGTGGYSPSSGGYSGPPGIPASMPTRSEPSRDPLQGTRGRSLRSPLSARAPLPGGFKGQRDGEEEGEEGEEADLMTLLEQVAQQRRRVPTGRRLG